MDTAYLISLIQESAYLLIVFAFFLVLGLWRGRYILIKTLLSLYLALLITLKFPYFDAILQEDATHNALLKILIFVLITGASIFMLRHHIPGDTFEKAFEGIGKKVLLAALATVVVMAFSYHALPVTEFIHPGTPIQTLFASEAHFFWWLILPLVLLIFI